ncbi:MAG: hypothetical protein ACE5IJ_06405 [Thermoplasmata archaeon]
MQGDVGWAHGWFIEVWSNWDWIFGIGFVLLLSTAWLWFVHVLFLLPPIAGVILVSTSVSHAEKRYGASKRRGE